MAIDLPPPVEVEPALKPVVPPPGSPDAKRKAGAKTDDLAVAQPAAEAPAEAPPMVAVLDFAGGRSKRVPLSCPFMDGSLCRDAVVINRLTMVQVDKLVSENRHNDLYEIYAEMTGVPAPVLRGMDADDGEAMMEAGADFLPRSLRKAFGFTSG
ncbi:hypothetical protein HNR60_001550 [Rhodopseudomonas rhenobacensis]|uniref:Uncharacterized protein n=1 Tax=Rhodopseudomonas rhenobacensis TaxID=87461 RepID=A0A7W8DYG0_9BRAD|nr:hypothetical protein [Rhodopseudomonas rhenobacensis]MBB5046802.1 hypothetical protein [Rhodopseudomonas rhenobacensis]